ncbi:MAG: hypothetical protein HY902_16430 [Deltaproteobacteria bacterium]|nr:hypothetical protein [Deltaproteobacteria bacterium]
MARTRKKAPSVLATATTPAAAVAQALLEPFDSFGIIAGASDRFGGEAVALATVATLAAVAADDDPARASGLALVLAQTGLPGESAAALDGAMRRAMAAGLPQHLDLLLPVCCAGVALDPAWLAPLAGEQRALLAKLVGGLAPRLEGLLAFHGALRPTTLDETLRAIAGT